MIRVIKQNELKLLIDLYKSIGRRDKEELKNIYYGMRDRLIVIGNVEDDKITSLLIANLINNEYYLEDIIFTDNDINEIKGLLTAMIKELRNDERGINIIYDNAPYSEILNLLKIEAGFKSDFVNFVNDTENRIELIRNRVLINDLSDDVNQYMIDNYNKEYELIKGYVGETLQPERLDPSKTNIAVCRDENDKVIGFLRFGLITDSIYISNIYGDTEEVIVDLINLVKNLTNRKIEIGIYPVRDDLINILLNNGFRKAHAEYKYKF